MKQQTPSCAEMEYLLSEYCDSRLSLPELCAVEAHLAQCPGCTALLADYRAIGGRLRRGARLTPPPSVRRAVLARVGQQRSQWLGAGYSLLRGAAVAAVMLLWVAGVVWLFQSGEAARLLSGAASQTKPVAEQAVPASEAGDAALSAEDVGGPALGQEAPELVWVHGGELWSATSEGRLRKVGVLPTPEGTLADFTVSPDGRRVAYVVYGSAGATLRVARVDGSNSDPLLNVGYAAGLTWAKYGRQLFVFAGDDESDLSLLSIAARDGSRSLLPTKAPFAFWSPSRRYLAHTAPLEQPGRQRVSIIDVASGTSAGGAEAALPEGYLAWAPDNSALLFAAYTQRPDENDRTTGPARIFSLRLGASVAAALQPGAPFADADYLHPRPSPDGRSIAFLYHPRQPGETVPPADPSALHTDLAVMAADGKGAQPLVGAAAGERIAAADWSPDSRFVAYLVNGEGGQSSQIWLVSAKGGSPHGLSPRYTDGPLPGGIEWVGGKE